MYNIVFTYTYIYLQLQTVFILDQIVSLAKYTMLQAYSINHLLISFYYLHLDTFLYFACVPNCKGKYSMI